ncbi:N-acetylglucosamine-6-phosphate deacetylase [Nesterenkonia halophila]
MTLISAVAALVPRDVDTGTPAHLAPRWLRVVEEHIVEVGDGPPPSTPDVVVDDGVLAPGFLDVHCHGGGGASFSEGAEVAATARAAHRVAGTTTMLASLVTEPLDVLAEQLETLRPLVASGELAGVHLEGPWLSPRHRGAHDPEHLVPPEPAALERLLGTGLVRMVTLAPELDGGLDAIRRVVAAGATAAIGHTDASYECSGRALDAGATAGTHLFNAMAGLHHREPGPAAALLERPEAFIELIADGVHVHPAMLRLAFAQHPERFVLVSDAMAAAAAADGAYRLGGLDVQVRDGVARLIDAEGRAGAIAGSTLTIAGAVRHAVREASVPPAQALAAATENPARMVGLDEVGRLAPGMRADLVHLDEDLAVRAVMHRGAWL